MLAFPAAIQTDDADLGTLGWVMHPRAVTKLRATLKTTADTASNFLMDEPGSLAGYPVAVTTAIADRLAAGDHGVLRRLEPAAGRLLDRPRRSVNPY